MTVENKPVSFPFVLLISRHRICGPIISAWETGPENDGKFLLGNRIVYPLQPGTPGEEICSLLKSLDDHEIYARFSRKGTVMKEFFENLPGELLSGHIRPYLDQQMDRIFRLALRTETPVFMNGQSKMVLTRDRLIFDHDPAEPCFFFRRRDDGTDYILEIFRQEKAVGLTDKSNQLICNDPCWFRAGNRLLHFPAGFDGKKIQPFLTKDVIRIPASAEKKYFETFILKTLKTGQVRAEGFTVTTLDPPRHMELSAEFDWQGNAILLVRFIYGGKKIPASRAQKIFIDLKLEGGSPAFYKTERDFEWESRSMNLLGDAGLVQSNPGVFVLGGEPHRHETGMYRLIEWLNRRSEQLAAKGIRVVADNLPHSYFTGKIVADIRVEQGTDWFDIRSTVRFGETEIPFTRLHAYILEGKREFPLPGGEMAVIPEEWFTRYGDLCYFSEIRGDRFRLPAGHFRIAGEIMTSPDQDVAPEPDVSFISGSEDITPPSSLHGTLRPYQAEGLQWLMFLHERNFGGCLADDMGLGKTIQVLSLLLTLQKQKNRDDHGDTARNPGPAAASLVVVPASLVHNWRNEILRFAPSLNILEHTGNMRAGHSAFFNTADVVLTTYGILRNDLEMLCTYRFRYIILDESQTVRNPASQIYQAVCSLSSDHRLALTGTPVENSLSDLWAQMNFLNPGLLGELAPFLKRFNDAVKLKKLISPFVLRRTKAETEPDLPPLTLKDLYCEMNPGQESLYEKEKSAVRNEILEEVEAAGSSRASIMILKALIRLRQIANHPLLVDPGFQGSSGKSEEILRIASTLHEEGHKTLIFSSFVKYLDLVASWFSEAGLPYTMLTGSTVNREEIIGRFRKDPACSFFLISLKAGGAGLNLPEADYVMILDPWWNPASEMQAIGRAHRIGQHKKVIALRFISKNSIEEKILVLQEKKRQLAGDFIPAGNPLKDLTREELKGLFG